MPIISESSLQSFMPAVAWSLLRATNTGIPEWVCENRAHRISEFGELLVKQEKRAIDWVTELAKTTEDGRPWLDLVQALERFRWDETAWRQDRLESILSLVIYCKEHPDDEQSEKHLQGELRYWQNRYGELGFKSFSEWKDNWEYWIGAIEYYEGEKFDAEMDDEETPSKPAIALNHQRYER